MFFLKKLISYFILPPGIFVVLLLVIGVLSKRNKAVRFLALSGALVLYLISTEPVKDLLYIPLERIYPVPDRVEGNAIVVLGGGVYGTGHLKGSSFKRLITGYKLHKDTGLPLILAGGSATGTVPEAVVMLRVLKELGADEKKIFIDDRSRDTRENALYTREICQRIGCSKVTLVTSAFHMKRAVEIFRKVGLEVQPYPTDFRTDLKYTVYSIFPKSGAFEDSAIAIREYIGIVFYKLFY